MNLCPSTLSDAITDGSGWSSWNTNYLDGSMILEAHAITEPWDEQTVTWNSKPSFNSAMMDAVPLTLNHTVYGDDPQWTTINVTEIAKDWYNGGANNGVLFKLNNGGSHAFAAEYYSDLWAMWEGDEILGVQPVISVSYRSKAGLENTYSYTSMSAGDAGTGYVQLNSGNLVFAHSDADVDGGSMPVSISHIYNTCNNQSNSYYGYGWTINYAQTLKQETLDGYTYYVYKDADATKHYFNITESKTAYEDESGLELELTIGSSTLKICDKDETVWTFSKSTGRLSSIQNAYGKSNVITYNDNGSIKTIKDGFGRTYSFSYTNNMLETITAPDGSKVGFNYSNLNLTWSGRWKNGDY